MNFNSHTDVVVRVAVDLVNLLTPGEERGRRYTPPEADERTAAVGAVLNGVGGREATWEEAASLCFVAAELRGVFEAVQHRGGGRGGSPQLNALLNRTGARPELERHDGEPWHLHFHAADRSLPDGWAAGCATGLAVVLGGSRYDRLGARTGPRCDRVQPEHLLRGTRRALLDLGARRLNTAAFRLPGTSLRAALGSGRQVAEHGSYVMFEWFS